MTNYVTPGYWAAGYVSDLDTQGNCTFDPTNKRIILRSAAITTEDIWRAWCAWMVIDDNAKYPPALQQVGGDDLGGGLFIPLYFFLLNGWRLRPMEANHTLVITGNLFVQGGGVPVVNTLGAYNVSVQYTVPVQAQAYATSGGSGSGVTAADVWAYGTRTLSEAVPTPPTEAQIAAAVWAYVTRALTTAPSGLTVDEAAKLTALHLVHGLDPNNPLVVGPNQRIAGPILQNITTVGETTTVERL